MYLLMNLQSRDNAKISVSQLVDTDKVCVSGLVERVLTELDCIVILQKVEECDKTGVEANPFDRT